MEATDGADLGGGGADRAVHVYRMGVEAEAGTGGCAAGDDNCVHHSHRDVEFAEVFRAAGASALAGLARRMVDGSAEKDLIVLGDFNEQHQRGNLHIFEEQGWSKLNHDATNLSSTEAYDNLLIDRRFTREWTGVAGTWR